MEGRVVVIGEGGRIRDQPIDRQGREMHQRIEPLVPGGDAYQGVEDLPIILQVHLHKVGGWGAGAIEAGHLMTCRAKPLHRGAAQFARTTRDRDPHGVPFLVGAAHRRRAYICSWPRNMQDSPVLGREGFRATYTFPNLLGGFALADTSCMYLDCETHYGALSQYHCAPG